MQLISQSSDKSIQPVTVTISKPLIINCFSDCESVTTLSITVNCNFTNVIIILLIGETLLANRCALLW